jgi:long-subunit fatty acid transport protein
MSRVLRRVGGAVCLTVALAAPAWAGGLWFYEQSTPDQGTAAAGRAAMAKDAFTAYGNPAGMSRLDSTQFLIGAGALVIQSEFETERGTNVGGGGATLTNTYHWSIGAMYRIAPPWLLTAGFAYDTSPVAENHRTVILALDRQIRYSAGVQYDLSQTSTLGVAYTLISTGDAPVNQDAGPCGARWSVTTSPTSSMPSASTSASASEESLGLVHERPADIRRS